MSIKKIIALIMLLITLAVRPSIAQEVEEEGDYTVLEQGEVAPHDGYLLTKDALIDLTIRTSTKIELLKNEKDTEKNIVKNNLETELKKKDLKVESLEIRNKELEKKVFLSEISVPVTAVITTAIMLGLFYASVQIAR